jgi:chromate transporter
MPSPTFKEALSFWTKLGFISFGGPAGQIAIMHEYLVVKKKWISEHKFLHALNYCMLLPGPEAQQLATYTGWLMHGTRGGLAAGLLFVLPSMFILLALSVIYTTFGNVPWINAMFDGLKPAVIAIIIVALIRIGKKSLQSTFHYFVAIIAFICIFFIHIQFPIIIVGAIGLAFILNRIFPKHFQSGSNHTAPDRQQELLYAIHAYSVLPHTIHSNKKLLKQVSAAVILWCIPVGLFYLLSTDFSFWLTLTTFFTKAAFVTFGGAYAVLPYVAQVSVEQLNWLSELQMIDGLALGETTPGPLIMVLTFVGFMAGYNHFGASLGMGALGLITTTWYTFLPCFVFILAGAPLIEKTQENKTVRQMLGVVTAAVVGVILNLTIYLGEAVFFPMGIQAAQIDYIALSWVAVSFAALYHWKINMISWIGISALFGLLVHLLI